MNILLSRFYNQLGTDLERKQLISVILFPFSICCIFWQFSKQTIILLFYNISRKTELYLFTGALVLGKTSLKSVQHHLAFWWHAGKKRVKGGYIKTWKRTCERGFQNDRLKYIQHLFLYSRNRLFHFSLWISHDCLCFHLPL